VSLDRFNALVNFDLNHLRYGMNTIIETIFEKGKRYFTKRSNKTYRYRIFRAQMRLVTFVSNIFETAMDKRYRPGGSGYFEAMSEFSNLKANLQSI
jgi:hypothetical protein